MRSWSRPGIAARGAFFDAARARGVPVFGDIELFARAVRAPVVGITGTNGKSTVTTLVGLMAERAGRRTRVGGNLGEPALELLDPGAELYVLELSSYQLDTTESLTLAAATVLNVTRRSSRSLRARSRTTPPRRRGSSGAAAPRCSTPTIRRSPRWARWRSRRLRFSLDAASGADYRLLRARRPANGSRAATSACSRSMNLSSPAATTPPTRWRPWRSAMRSSSPRAAMLEALREFPGLPHRTEWVADVAGVRYVDDSKGTNVGRDAGGGVRTFDGPLLLIAGGDGKGQDFTAAGRGACAARCGARLLIGRDARALGAALGWQLPRSNTARRSKRPWPQAAHARARRATPCCCRRPARASTCSATTRTAARCSRPPCGGSRHERAGHRR